MESRDRDYFATAVMNRRPLYCGRLKTVSTQVSIVPVPAAWSRWWARTHGHRHDGRVGTPAARATERPRLKAREAPKPSAAAAQYAANPDKCARSPSRPVRLGERSYTWHPKQEKRLLQTIELLGRDPAPSLSK